MNIRNAAIIICLSLGFAGCSTNDKVAKDEKKQETSKPEETAKAPTGNDAVIQSLLDMGYVNVNADTYLLEGNGMVFEKIGPIVYLQFDFEKKNFAVKVMGEESPYVLAWEVGEAVVFGEAEDGSDTCVYDLLTNLEKAGTCDLMKEKRAMEVSIEFFKYISDHKLYLSNLYV